CVIGGGGGGSGGPTKGFTTGVAGATDGAGGLAMSANGSRSATVSTSRSTVAGSAVTGESVAPTAPLVECSRTMGSTTEPCAPPASGIFTTDQADMAPTPASVHHSPRRTVLIAALQSMLALRADRSVEAAAPR